MPSTYENCVRQVKAHSPRYNPWAVCTVSVGRPKTSSIYLARNAPKKRREILDKAVYQYGLSNVVRRLRAFERKYPENARVFHSDEMYLMSTYRENK